MERTLIVLLLAGLASAGDGNLLVNGGFERELDGWFWLTNSGRASAGADAEEKAEGRRALHISKRGGFPVDVLGQSFDIPDSVRGKRLVVSARVRGKNVGNTWLKFFLYDKQGDSLDPDVDIKQLRGSFKWDRIERTFKVPKTAETGKVLLQVFMGGEIWIDDVRVEPKGAKRKKPPKPLDKRTRKWLDDNAIPVATVDPKAPFRDLEPLKKALEGVRIVQLGENTHGDGACFLAKCRLIRWLHEVMGFNVVAFECDRANELIRPGGDAKQVMKAGIFRIWHTKNTLPLFEYMIECAGTRQPLVLAGYDPQQSGEWAKQLVPRLRKFLGAAESAAMPALKKTLEARRAELEEKHGKAEVAFWFRAVENDEVWQKLQKLDGADYFNLRDEWMGKNLIWLAEERFKDQKIVVWAATRHIAHQMKTIRRRGRPQYEDTKCMGEYVHEHFGEKCYTVGFAAHGGRGGRWFQAKWDLPPPEPRSIEDTLYRYGKPLLFVDFRAHEAGPFHKPLKLSVLAYVRDYSARWPDVIDGLFYIEEMVPAAYMGD